MATTDNGGDVTLTDCGAVMSTGCESLSVTSMGFSEVSSSSPNTGGDYSEFYQRAQLITGLFLYPLFCLFGLIGNCLTIVVLRGRKLRSVTSMFLIALSLSDGVKLITDLFYFVVVLLLNTSPASGELAMGYMYPYAHYFFNASLCVTAWLTVSLAAERYILVCHVAHAKQWCNVNRAQLTIAVVYLSMSLFSMPFAFRYRTIWTEIQAGGNNDTSAVDFTTSGARPQYSVSIVLTELWADKEFAKTYSWIQNILRSIVPLLIMSTLNCFIVDALRRSARHVSAGVSSTGGYVHQRHVGRRVSPRNRRVTLMLVAVIIVFIVCVTPDAVMSTVFGFGYYDESSDLIRGIREITDFLLLVNSACNFLLYCAFNSVFRHRFRTLVVRQFYSCCCCCRRWLRCRLRPSGLTNCIATTNAMQPTVKGSPTLLPLNKSEMAAPADAIKNSPPLDSESESSEADVNGNSNGGNAIPMTSTRLRMRPPPPSGTDVTKSDLKTDDALLQLPRWCDTTSENCHGDGGGGIVVMPSALKHDNVVIAMDRPRDDDVSNETAIFSMRLRRESVDEHDESSDWL